MAFHAPCYDGKNLGFTAQDDRQLVEVATPGIGVVDLGDLLVSAGSGMNSSIAAGRAAIRNTFATTQGGIYVVRNDAAVAKQHNASDPTNPRIDKIYCKVYDSETGGDASDIVDGVIQAGTATGGATLDNLTGANPTVPTNSILLADVLVHANDASAASFTYRDRRPIATPVLPPSTKTVLQAVTFIPVLPSVLTFTTNLLTSGITNQQAAAAFYLPRRIINAAKIRWAYVQGGTAQIGNYNIGIADASGRMIVSTGSIALAGTSGTNQQRSESISATTFEAGIYYVVIGGASLSTGNVSFQGVAASTPPVSMPNLALVSATGGITMPATILSYTDVNGAGSMTGLSVPLVSLSTT